jgi:hypothetical protein
MPLQSYSKRPTPAKKLVELVELSLAMTESPSSDDVDEEAEAKLRLTSAVSVSWSSDLVE